jgi:Tol biopolymer transport system component
MRMINQSIHPATPRSLARRWGPIAFPFGGALLVVVCCSAAAVQQPFGDWGAPVNLDTQFDPSGGINTNVNDGCPIESPDGQMLFLASNRVGSQGMNDIWVAMRDADGSWGAPEAIAAINSPANDFCPSPLPGNRLMFVSTRAGNCGGSANNADIYLTRWHPVRGWEPPTPLDCAVNSEFDEFSPSLVEADGRTMLFFSRGIGMTNHKIHMSVLQADGTWSVATPVEELNVAGASDARPNVRKDGLEIVFDSTREFANPQIYSSSRASIDDPWSVPERLPFPINRPEAQQTRASLSRDATRLYFGSNRAGGEGAADIYVATRPGPGARSERQSSTPPQ